VWSDRLRSTEEQQTKRAIRELSGVKWAQPLLLRLESNGGLRSENMPLMFEVRYAYELHRAGVTAEYEFAAGVGESTIEFRLQTTPTWLIELVSVRTSDAAKRAIRQVGMVYEQCLIATPDDPGRGEAGEIITAEYKIGEKVFANKRPTKFPALDGSFRLIVTDIRGYLDQGGDCLDYREMAYGSSGIPRHSPWAPHHLEIQPGPPAPIRGLFEAGNPLQAARYVQERIHFLGFVRERDFVDGEIPRIARHMPNWYLFATQDEARRAYATYPLCGPVIADERGSEQ
jgi:hypothetical protein